MQDMMIQVTFLDISMADDQPIGLRIGELVNPFTVDSLGVNVEADSDKIDVLVLRSSGEEQIFRVNQAQIDSMLPVVRRNGQWVVVG